MSPHPLRLARSILRSRRMAVQHGEAGITRVWPDVVWDWITCGWSRGVVQPAIRRVSREHRADNAREQIESFLEYAASEEIFLTRIGDITGMGVDSHSIDSMISRWTRYQANFRTWPRWLVRAYLLRYLVVTRARRHEDGTVLVDGWRINTSGRRPLLLRYLCGVRAEGYAGAELISKVHHLHRNPVPVELMERYSNR